jgi:UPF0271 protein
MLYLIDSSAVLNDFGFEFRPEHKYITTPLVINEFRDMRSRNLMENALQQGLLSIEEPKKETTNYVEDTVAEKGFTRLSRPDLSLIALALDLKKRGKEFLLVTDDFSIQNFCSLLEIPFQDAIRGKIEKEISFSLECPACGKTLEMASKARKCPVCGSSLRRKRLEK